MILSMDNNSDMLWEAIIINPLIFIQGSVSTGCLIHFHARGCDFKGNPWHFDFSVGYRLQIFPVVRKHALALRSPGNVFLDGIMYFLQLQHPLRFDWHVNSQQAEKKLAPAKDFQSFCLSTVKFLCFPFLPRGVIFMDNSFCLAGAK